MAPLQDLPTNFIDIALADSFRTGAATDTDKTNQTDATGTAQAAAGQTRNTVLADASPNGDFVPPNDLGDDVYERKLAQCRAACRPADVIQDMLVATIAAQTIRLDWLRRSIASLHALEAYRARYCWIEDHRAEAAEIADGIRRRPASVRRKLERSLHGCDLLIERWEALKAILEQTGSWNEIERALVLDLLGIPPELRRGLTLLDPGPGEDAATVGIALAQRELERLRARLAPLLRLDEYERHSTEQGRPPRPSRDMKQLRRHEAQSERFRSRALDDLARIQQPQMQLQPAPALQPEAGRKTAARVAPKMTGSRPFFRFPTQTIKDMLNTTDDNDGRLTAEDRAALAQEVEERRQAKEERLAARAETAEEDEKDEENESAEDEMDQAAVGVGARPVSSNQEERRRKERRHRQRSSRKRNRRK